MDCSVPVQGNTVRNIHVFSLCVSQVGTTWHAFSLAWLEADWYLSEGGLARLIRKRVQERLCIILLFFYGMREVFYSFCLLERDRTCRDVLCTDPVIWEFFFWDGAFCGGKYVWDTLLTIQKDTLDNWCTPVWYVPSRPCSPSFQLFLPNYSLVLILHVSPSSLPLFVLSGIVRLDQRRILRDKWPGKTACTACWTMGTNQLKKCTVRRKHFELGRLEQPRQDNNLY